MKNTALTSRDQTTQKITRGGFRFLSNDGQSALAEFKLPTNRRVDLAGLSKKGLFSFLEVKSCKEDFLVDQKWAEYRAYCDLFYFLIAPDFPRDLIPLECGLIITDGFDAEIIRQSEITPLAPARRKSLTLLYARQAATRLSNNSSSPT